MNATQNFSFLNYSFEKFEDGEKLVLDLRENKNTTYLKFGLHYDDLYKSGILLNYTKKKIIAKNDVLSFDVILGDNTRYNFDYYVDNGFYWSYGFNSKLVSFNKNVSTDFGSGDLFGVLGINSVNVDFLDVSNQVYFQTIFAQKISIGTGLEYKHLKIKSQTIENTEPVFDNSGYLSVFGYAKYDSFDQKYFPRSGMVFNGELKSFLYSTDHTNKFERFSVAKADFALAKTFYKTITLRFQTEGGFAFGERGVSFFDFILGGYGFQTVNNFKPFLGYDFLSVSGDSYVKGIATIDYEFYKKHHLNFAANFANVGDRIFEDTKLWLNKPAYTGYSFGYGMETIIGPIEIKHSWSPESRNHYTWFSVGFWF